MSDETFRDELVTFSLSTEGGGGSGSASTSVSLMPASSSSSSSATAADAEPSINPAHRPRLLPVVIRLVYGRLAASGSRGRAGGHGGPAARRVAVLAFLSSLCSEELAELFSLMVRPFLQPTPSSETLTVGSAEGRREEDAREEGLAEWDDVAGGAAQAREVLERAAGVTPERLLCVSASRQAGFLKMVKEVARQLGQRALPFVETLLGLVLALLEHSNVVSEVERRSRGGEGGDPLSEAGGRDEEQDEEEDEEDAIDEEEPVLASRSTRSSPETSPSTGEINSNAKGGRIAPGALRTLSLRALSELFSQYSTTFDFVGHQDTLWPALVDPIARLPASTVGAVRAPALLALAEKLTDSEALLPMFSGHGGEALVPAVLDCISAGSASGRVAGPAVVGSALTIVERLLRYDGGSILSSHLNHLISNFAARLSVTGTSGKGVAGGAGGLDSHTEQGLTILARIAEMATSGPLGAAGGGAGAVDASSLSTLVALLVPSLQPDRRASDEAKSSILRTVSALARRVDSPGARRAWPSLSRLLGPAGARPSGMAAAGPRGELVRALEALASRPDLEASAGPAVSLVVELNARDAVALDEPDFSRAVPAYNSLSEGSSWADVVAAGGVAVRKVGGGDAMAMDGENESEGEDEVTAAAAAAAVAKAPLGGLLAAAPVAQHCFHCMHDQEVAIRGAAGAALKRLAREVAARERASPGARAGGRGAGERRERCPWEGLMRTVLMPGLRAGMACRTETVRKGYISLLRETVSAYQETADGGEGSDGTVVAAGGAAGAGSELSSSSVVPADLWVLARADDPESDFFLNACHMQVHRRARALAKARKAIEDAEAAAATTTTRTTMMTEIASGAADAAQSSADTTGATPPSACPFRVSTLVHFLLPLALHPLHEAAKSAEAGLVGQAILLAGAIARHLPWTHYNSALRGLIQQVAGGGESDGPEKERAMIGALCGVLDGFHFALLPPDDEAAALRAAAPGAEPGGGGGRGAAVAAAAAAAAAAGAGTGDAVWRAVNGRLLGSLRSLLTKEVRGKSGGKEKVLRAPVALGMLNLVRRLPAAAFKLQLQPLMMTVCQSLKSRDSNARDTARDTLAKMARELGPEYLQQVGGWVGECFWVEMTC